MHASSPNTTLPAEALDTAESVAEIARIRDQGLLGRAGRLTDLFDYLLDRSLKDDPPKEVEIVSEVFSGPGERAPDDAVARVYIHRLRKRLDEIALRGGSKVGVRLSIPLGEYRLVAERLAEPQTAPRPPSPVFSTLGSGWTWFRGRPTIVALVAAIAILAAGNVFAWTRIAGEFRQSATQDLARSDIWAPIASGDGPLLVVVGDYYMFGEYEDRLFLTRLIRDFSINSKQDLVESYLTTPEAFDQYGDVALQYLPTSTAFALADIAPVLAERDVRVTLASEITETQLRDNDILYVGLISGLGRLMGPVFTKSRFSLGESYDVIHDATDQRTYTSEAFLAAPSDAMYRDYGLYKSFSGPTGNQIVVLAGARDTALMGLSEAMVSPQVATELKDESVSPTEAEALFEVQGHKHANLRARLLAADEIESAQIWSSSPQDMPVFPAR